MVSVIFINPISHRMVRTGHTKRALECSNHKGQNGCDSHGGCALTGIITEHLQATNTSMPGWEEVSKGAEQDIAKAHLNLRAEAHKDDNRFFFLPPPALPAIV